ncbi:MAG: hemolysin family protein [Phycisphaeraceae bacterium]
MNLAITIALIAAVLSCYFAALHVAMKTFSRKRLADVLDRRGRLGELEPFIVRLPGQMLLSATLRTCLSLVVVLSILYAVELRAGIWAWLPRYAVAFGIAGVVLSVFSVAIPTSWARYRCEELLATSMPLMRVLLVVLRPVVAALHLFDPLIRRISGADLVSAEDQLSDQVLSVVEEHDVEASVDEAQKEMLEAVFELPGTTAEEIMTPRTDIKGIEATSSLFEVKQAIMDFGHSRIPVYEENLDHVVGILYAKDMIRFLGDGDEFDLRTVVREAFMVPESKSVRELLAEFKGRKVHMAIVLDEYGGTAGLVTIEDILEEIVGDIRDEYEPTEEQPQISTLDEKTAVVDARMRIDDLNDEMNLDLPENEDYDTVGGFVFAALGHIPEKGETFEFPGLRFTVTEAERTKVRRVRVEKLASEATPSNGG